MALHNWLNFVGASIIILLIPGQPYWLVIGDSLAARGRSVCGTVGAWPLAIQPQ